jgi:para-nitrobenzyl esterase
MVWIHGGAFANGSGAVAQYAGDRFARDGVVCVTINYRLGADGFVFLDDATPNLGLLDQLAALEWVHDNIPAFGGDPDNVTIFGESAGAMSVVTLLSMPRSEGLVRRAIAQSGAGHHTISVSTARLIAADLTSRLGVQPRRDALADVPLDRLDAAQRAMTAEIASAPDPSRWGEVVLNLLPFEPVVDGDILPARPLERFNAGAASDVDLLIGTNRNENRLFLVPTGIMDVIDEPTLSFMTVLLGQDVAALDAYRTARPGASEGEILEAVTTDWMFRIPAIRVAEAHQRGRGSTHMYEFAWPSPLLDGRLGACHALEIGFVFDTIDAEGGDLLFGPSVPRELVAVMHAAWVQFATKGDPGWDAYDLIDRATMIFDRASHVVSDPRSIERALWDGRR